MIEIRKSESVPKGYMILHGTGETMAVLDLQSGRVVKVKRDDWRAMLEQVSIATMARLVAAVPTVEAQ